MATGQRERWSERVPPLRQVLWTAGAIAGTVLVLRLGPWVLQLVALLVAVGCVLGLLATEPNTGRWA